MVWNDRGAEAKAAEKPDPIELSVRFVEDAQWELPLNTRKVPASLRSNRRVIAISEDAGVAAPATATPAHGNIFARKAAWVMWRARAVAERLRAA